MAKIIVFYVPAIYHAQVKWIPSVLRGKVLEFRAKVKKSA